MRQGILVLATIVMAFTTKAQVELKGVTLGAIDNKEMLITTVAGIDGVILTDSLNDGRTFRISFLPSDDGASHTRVSGVDVDNLIAAAQNKYGIKIKKVKKDSYGSDWYAFVEKDGVRYYISAEKNRYMTPSTKFVFQISNLELVEISKIEEQAKATDDM